MTFDLAMFRCRWLSYPQGKSRRPQPRAGRGAIRLLELPCAGLSGFARWWHWGCGGWCENTVRDGEGVWRSGVGGRDYWSERFGVIYCECAADGGIGARYVERRPLVLLCVSARRRAAGHMQRRRGGNQSVRSIGIVQYD